MTGKREVERLLSEAEEDADTGEWSDVEEWRAFITGENPRTGEPISDERRAKYRRAWGAFAADDQDREESR